MISKISAKSYHTLSIIIYQGLGKVSGLKLLKIES